jgi:integrase/recombinase XerD
MTVRIVTAPSRSPLRDLVADYLASCRARGLMPKSLKQYHYALEAGFLPWCEREGISSLAELDQRQLDRFTAGLHSHRTAAGKPLSRASIHTYIRPVRLMLTWAGRQGETVTAKPQLPRRERQVRDVLSREELDRLEAAMPTERDRLILRIFADCGLRLEELTRLRASDIMRSRGQAYLRVLGKRDRPRDVPLQAGLLRRLDRFVADREGGRRSDALFLAHRRGPLGDYEPLTTAGVYQVVKEAVERAGISRRVYPHLLRHSWMTEMLRRGMNPLLLSFIAGASPEVIAACYTHLTKEDAYEATMRALAPQRVR